MYVGLRPEHEALRDQLRAYFTELMTPALAATAKPPVRLAFVYLPNGIDMRNWTPSYDGPFRELPPCSGWPNARRCATGLPCRQDLAPSCAILQ